MTKIYSIHNPYLRIKKRTAGMCIAGVAVGCLALGGVMGFLFPRSQTPININQYGTLDGAIAETAYFHLPDSDQEFTSYNIPLEHGRILSLVDIGGDCSLDDVHITKEGEALAHHQHPFPDTPEFGDHQRLFALLAATSLKIEHNPSSPHQSYLILPSNCVP